jgi:hypothetical protein
MLWLDTAIMRSCDSLIKISSGPWRRVPQRHLLQPGPAFAGASSTRLTPSVRSPRN